MAWIPAAISAGGSLLGGLLGRSGQSSANAANLRIAREQMEFQERMSNTEYQRSVADLKAAGLNPMLGMMKGGGASTPPGAMSRVENENAPLAGSVSEAASRVAELQAVRASTRKTLAEAKLVEASVPFSGESAIQSVRKLSAETEAAIDRAEITRIERLSESDLYAKLQPLLIEYQEYVTKAAKLGLPEAEAVAKFWEMMSAAGNTGKAAEFLKKMIGGLAISTRGGNTYNPTTIIRR